MSIAFSRVSLPFLDRLLPNVNVVPSRFWLPLGLPCLQVDPMAARKKGDLVLYSGDLFPEGEKNHKKGGLSEFRVYVQRIM